MKIRLNFVSNSSSASFILVKEYLTKDDVSKILDYNKKSRYENWNIKEDSRFLKGFTVMDNGYLFDWIKKNLNIPFKAIKSYERD